MPGSDEHDPEKIDKALAKLLESDGGRMVEVLYMRQVHDYLALNNQVLGRIDKRLSHIDQAIWLILGLGIGLAVAKYFAS
ncbi:hypothetical protein [Mesorhizobium sp. KR9-304]|uniref:hypothetical protein n=1 Tax=Mesorhizobium sp. KR9-304 TaxID=3156614 RepID=UPI0032B4B82A